MKKTCLSILIIIFVSALVTPINSMEPMNVDEQFFPYQHTAAYYEESADVPTWMISDYWMYTLDLYSDTENGTFDLSSQDLMVTVQDISDYQKNNRSIDAYHLVISGTVTGTFQADLLSGDVNGVINGEAYVRRADLSMLYSNITSFGIISVYILEYDYLISNENNYLIPFEYVDFPVVPGEQWNTTSYISMNSSIYVEDFIDNSSSETTYTNGSVNCTGIQNLSTAVGVLETYHMISDQNGSIETWYNQDIKNFAKAVLISNEENETNNIYLNITQYGLQTPEIRINQSISPKPSPILQNNTIHGILTNNFSGDPVANTLVTITIPILNVSLQTMTDSTGFFTSDFFLDPFVDFSPTSYDLGSDGVVTTLPSFPDSTLISTLIAVNNLSTIAELHQGWNFISIPFNQSIDPNALIIEYEGYFLKWSEATTEQNPTGDVLLNSYLFEWNRTFQSYQFASMFHPGFGYWVFAAEDCIISSKLPIKENTSLISIIYEDWNAFGIRQQNNINKFDMNIVCDGSNYSWNEAVAQQIINSYIFTWDATVQSYLFSDQCDGGKSYWVYSYQDCIFNH